MALDGPEIVCGDLAADLVGGFKDKYDAGADQEELEHWADMAMEEMTFDDVEREIWVSVCAQCFWEVGMLTADFLEIYDDIVSDGYGVKFWNQYDLGEVRKKELQELRDKISKPNHHPKPREKYSQVETTELIFQPNTAVYCKIDSGEYRSWIIVDVQQYRGRCTYLFTPTTYTGEAIPSVKELTYLLGTKIGYGFPKDQAIIEQPGIEEFWNDPDFSSFEHRHEKGTPDEFKSKHFTIGLVFRGVEHKDLLDFKDQFSTIGLVPIAKGFKKSGSYRSAKDFDQLSLGVTDIDKDIKTFDYLRIPIDRILSKD